MRQDPGETKNVYKAFSRRAEDLRLQLEKMAGSGVQAAPDEDDARPRDAAAAGRARLRGRRAAGGPEAVLPDPKDKIALFERMGERAGPRQGREARRGGGGHARGDRRGPRDHRRPHRARGLAAHS